METYASMGVWAFGWSVVVLESNGLDFDRAPHSVVPPLSLYGDPREKNFLGAISNILQGH